MTYIQTTITTSYILIHFTVTHTVLGFTALSDYDTDT